MNKLLILCCINIISVIYAAPATNYPKIDEILQLDFLKKCPAVLNNNIAKDKDKSDGGLSHCKNITIGNTPGEINLFNINEFYCIGLLAADIQLCSGNRTNKVPKIYDDLKANIDKIKIEKPEKVCSDLRDLKLFNGIENVTYLDKWIEVLDKHLHSSACAALCSDIEHSNTNVLCSLIYYINNNISYVEMPEKKLIPPEKVTTIVPLEVKDNAQQKATTDIKAVPVKIDAVKPAKTESSVEPAISVANVKDNGPSVEVKTEKQIKSGENASASAVMIPQVNNQPAVVAVEKPHNQEEPVAEITTVKSIPSVQKNDQPVGNDAQVKTIQITEESKVPSPAVNPNTVEENQKVPANVDPTTVSSTISGARDELADDYFEEVDEINKENEGIFFFNFILEII